MSLLEFLRSVGLESLVFLCSLTEALPWASCARVWLAVGTWHPLWVVADFFLPLRWRCRWMPVCSLGSWSVHGVWLVVDSVRTACSWLCTLLPIKDYSDVFALTLSVTQVIVMKTAQDVASMVSSLARETDLCMWGVVLDLSPLQWEAYKNWFFFAMALLVDLVRSLSRG